MAEQALRERIAESSGWDTVRQLGRGQYGVAYLVEWGDRVGAKGNGADEKCVAGDQAVAKVVGLQGLPEKEKTAAFQEVDFMRDLRHPHIVSLIDHFLTEGAGELVIVMEYCDSGDLRSEVKRRAVASPPDLLPEAQIMLWFFQLTLALNYIHERRILHRDLKSSNIFLTTSPESEGEFDVKIGDFGIARVLEGTLAEAATVVGTPYYMSPEVCKSEPYGFKSDIWALGCVLYEMCMLRHAFESQSLLGLVYKIVSETHDAIPEEYSSGLRALLERVLDKSQYTRPSGQDLVADEYVRSFQRKSTVTITRTEHQASSLLSQPPAPVINEKRKGTPPQAQIAQVCQAQPAPLQTHNASCAAGTRQSLRPPALRTLGGALGHGPPRSTQMGVARGPELAPLPPDASPVMNGFTPWDDKPGKRIWCADDAAAPSKGSGVGVSCVLDEKELKARVILHRMRVALSSPARRQNWLQVFASFDRVGNGHLRAAEFEQAVISMALGVSHDEIRAVCVFLQGATKCVPVDRFGAALNQPNKEVSKLEEWGRGVVANLLREAEACESSATDASRGRVTIGALVRVKGLANLPSAKLEGLEGVVEEWDALNSRWLVKMSIDGSKKSIRDEHLVVLRAAGTGLVGGLRSNSGNPDTRALYRMLCQGGEDAVPEERFLSVVQCLLPHLTEAERLNLLTLLPKSPDGRVDVLEVLAQFVSTETVADKTIKMPPLPCLAPGVGVPMPLPSPQAAQRRGPPGYFLSPTRNVTPPGPGVGVVAPTSAQPSSAGGGAGSWARNGAPPTPTAVVALLRLAQRLVFAGPGNMCSPRGKMAHGLHVVRLFASSPVQVRLDEFCDAVSVLPLGISRAEVQGIFAHVRAGVSTPDFPEDVLPFSLLQTAIDSALAAGVPSEAPPLERLDKARLCICIQRLMASSGGRVSPQGFRFALMQAQPYLTPYELEWLLLLTDKDGEGQLLPRSLLSRITSDRYLVGATGGDAFAPLLPKPTPTITRSLVAKSLPRSVVCTVILRRIGDRLRAASPQLLFECVLRLFDLDLDAVVSRPVLSSLLAQLRLGVSAQEADVVVSELPGPGGPIAGTKAGTGNVQVCSLLEAMWQSSCDPGASESLHEAAKDVLTGRADSLAATILSTGAHDFWIPEAEFRQCLNLALTDDSSPWSQAQLGEDAEDRLVLLADKRATGEVQWRTFLQRHAGWQEPDFCSDRCILRASKNKVPIFAPMLQTKSSEVSQSWRSQKMSERPVTDKAFTPTMKEEEDLLEGSAFIPRTKCQCCVS